MMDAGCDVSESVTVGVVIQVGALIGILGISDLTARLPVNVAATGPKVTTMAAKLADVVTITVPAVPQHLSRAVNNVRQASADRTEKVRITALLNVCPHHDEKTALTLASGVAASLGRLVVMQDSGVGLDDDLREEVLRAKKAYDMTHHAEAGTSHAVALSDYAVGKLVVAGSPGHCVERIRELMTLGVDRIVLNHALLGPDKGALAESSRLLLEEVLPRLRQ